MTPKEKADELIHKYYSLDCVIHEMDGGGGLEDARQMALICVDEILPLLFSDYKTEIYYQEVKQELEKL